MTVWIDPPAWPAHGRLWSHLVSDSDLDELHDFAAAQGIPRRGFEGDHYDVPEERYADVVAAGAHETTTREVLAKLSAAGLRLRKRRGEKGIARIRGLEFNDGSLMDVDLVRGPNEAPNVFAAMVLVTAPDGSVAVTWSPRRVEWSLPGGGREPGEPVAECAAREVREETGLELDPEALVPWGYERFTVHRAGTVFPPGGGALQLFHARVPEASPLVAELPDSEDPHWVTGEEFEALCGDRFWWPAVAWALSADGPARG